MQSPGGEAERGGSGEVGLGVRLAELHDVAGDDHPEGLRRELGQDRRHEPLVRHGHQRARRTGRGQPLQHVDARRAATGTELLDPGDHAVEELLDDLLGRRLDAHVLADVAARLQQVVADQVEGVRVAPGAAVPLSDLELGVDPVRLGVDQGAVHVPQDGRRQPHSPIRALTCRFSRNHGVQNALLRRLHATIHATIDPIIGCAASTGLTGHRPAWGSSSALWWPSART